MIKLLWLAVLASLACRMVTGRWPWQWLALRSADRPRINQARKVLGVPEGASRQVILDAHRRLVTTVHPDRGGTNERVHEANEARDILLVDLDSRSAP